MTTYYTHCRECHQAIGTKLYLITHGQCRRCYNAWRLALMLKNRPLKDVTRSKYASHHLASGKVQDGTWARLNNVIRMTELGWTGPRTKELNTPTGRAMRAMVGRKG